jgi:uncharacterized protein YbjT (DUF2867 family)
MLIAVHGATGTQGAPVVRRLLADGHRVRAIGRDPDPSRLPDGAEPAPADLLDVQALARAYTGADGVVVVLPGGAPDDVAVAQAEAILEALRRARVPRAVFNAGGGVWSAPPGLPFLDARTRLADGLPSAVATAVVVGPATAYMENLSEVWVVDRLRATGELVQTAPAEVPMSPVAVDDVASVIAEALVKDDPPPRVVVHGPGQVTGEEAAKAIAAHLGRPVRWTRVSLDEYLRGVAGGLGKQYAQNIGRLYGADADVPPPDPPGPEARHVTGATTLTEWVPTQRWD